MTGSFIKMIQQTYLTNYWTVCDLLNEIEDLELKPDTNELPLLKIIKDYLNHRKDELLKNKR